MTLSRKSKRLLTEISQHCEKAGHTYLDEYKLITKKQSTMTAMQRAFLCYFVEMEIKKVKDEKKD